MNKSGFVIVDHGPHQVGLQNAEGHPILSCVYDSILDYDDDGYVRFLRKGFYGTVDFDGHICIPHSLELTHLGVFHGGSARAQHDGRWGLVNPQGKVVAPFVYQSVEAYQYKKKAYAAVTLQGQKGLLTPDGHFSGGIKQPQPKPKPEPKPEPQPKPIPQPKPQPQPQPKPVPKKKKIVFDKEAFLSKVKAWCHIYGSPMKFYYFDSEAPLDILKHYKVGNIVRAGRYVDITDQLMRPVAPLRFLIATHHFAPVAESQNFRQNVTPPRPFRKNIVHPDSLFLVKDIFRCGGKTQILLLHLPQDAVRLALKHGVKLTSVKVTLSDGIGLVRAAHTDFVCKLSETVHGLSLSDAWRKEMYPPLGLDESLQPVSLDPIAPDFTDEAEKEFSNIVRYLSEGYLSDWEEKKFEKEVVE